MAFQSRLELIVDSRSGEQRLRAFENQLNRAEGAGDRLSEGMSVLKMALGAAAAAVGGFSVGRVVTETASFEQSLLKLQVVSGATATQMAALESQSRQLGATSVFSAKQAADAQNFLAMAGLNVNEVLSATPGILQLATAGQMDLASAADLASNVLGGFRLEVGELNRVNDVLAATAARSNTSITQLGDALSYAAPLAATAGISIEETAAAIGVLSDAGLQSSRAGTGLLGFIRQLSNLTPQATAALSNYGLTAAEVNIEQEGLIAVLDRLQKANINTADSFRIFGSEAGPAAQILAAGAVRVNEFTGELELAEGTAAKAALTLGTGLEGSMRSFSSAVGEATLQLGRDSGLSGQLQEVINTSTGVISVYNGMLLQFQEANNLTDQQAQNLQLMATGISLTTGAVGGLTAAYVGLTAATWAAHAAQVAFTRIMRANPLVLAASAAAALGGALYTARNATVEFGQTQASVTDWLQAAWQVSGEIIQESMQGASDNAIGAIESITGPVSSVTTYMWETFKALMTNIGNIAQTTINSMIGYFGTIGDVVGIVTRTMQTLFSDAFDNILNVASGFWQSVQAVFSGDLTFSAFNTALDNLTSGFVGTMAGAADEIGAAFRENMDRNYLGEVFDSLSGGARFVADDFTKLGERISDAAFVARMSRNGFGVVAEGFSEGKTQAQLLQEEIERLNQGLGESEESAKAAAKETYTLADAYESLLDRITPNRREARQYAQDLGTLNLALASGRMTAQQYMQAMGMLQESFQAAQRETGDLSDNVDAESDRMATLWERRLERMDDAGVDMWRSFLDGSEDAFGSFRRLALDTLAEVIHAYTTQRITASLGLNVAGGGASGGGLSFNGIGSLINGGKSLLGIGSSAATPSLAMQGGLSSAALASASQVAGGAAYSGWAGSAASGAALGNVASTGIMSSITAGVSAAMPWIAGGLAIDSLLGGGITKAISGLFGGGKTAPKFELITTDSNTKGHGVFEDYGSGVVSRGAFGAVGFSDQGTARLQETFGGFENATAFLDQIAAMDNALGGLARSEVELSAMASAVKSVRLNAKDASGITDQLGKRTIAAVSALDGEFGEFVSSLGTDVDTIIARTQSAMGALNLLGAASENLNLQFNASASGALRAADSIAQIAGGIEQLASLQDGYYQAYYSDTERAANLQRELTQELAKMGYALPSTREGFRALVEQQSQLTESGQRNYVQLLQLAGSFDQMQTMLANAGSGVDSFADQLSRLNDEIGSLENDVRQAYQAFERQAFDQQVQLLGMMGDEQTALALQRERELLSIDPLLHETQRFIWAMEDEAAAKERVTQAAQNYRQEIGRVRDQLGTALGGINQWIDQRNATGQTPGLNLEAAGEQFARQLVLAESGDRNALQSITQYADQYLAAGEAMFASGGAFQSIQQDVLSALQSLPEQISSEEYLAKEIRDALQSVVISEMPTDERLAVQLSNELTRLDANQLTAEQVRSALAPHATDAEISRLIREVDANGDGIISKQELANQRLAGLASGIGSTLKPMFDSIDLDASGLINWQEFYSVFAGMASDEELRRIFAKLDEDGSGTISRLEALNRSNEGTEANTDSLEKQARDQLRELNGLVSEMARSTDQFVGLNTTMVSLRDSINALGVAQEEIARIERERVAAEQAERERIERERQAAQRQAQMNSMQQHASQIQESLNSAQASSSVNVSNASINGVHRDWRHAERNINNVASTYLNAHGVSEAAARRLEEYFTSGAGRLDDGGAYAPGQRYHAYVRDYVEEIRSSASAGASVPQLEAQLRNLRNDYRREFGELAPFAEGGYTGPGGKYEPAGIVHRGEVVWSQDDISAWGGVGVVESLRNRSGSMPTPNLPLPQFPALGQNDVLQVLQDVRRELVETRKQNQRLQEENNRHAAAAVAVQQAGFNGQINELKKSNLALDDMSAASRLEASR